MTNLMKLLQPGIELKRWALLVFIGILLTSLGFAYLLVHIYRVQPLPEAAGTLTLQFIERPVRGAMFIIVGVWTRDAHASAARTNAAFAAAFASSAGVARRVICKPPSL